MNHTAQSGRNGTRDASILKSGRVSIGWKLAGVTALVVTAVMGGTMVIQHRNQVAFERELSRQFLIESLAPLAFRIQRAVDREGISRELALFCEANRSSGNQSHFVELRDGKGNLLAGSHGTPLPVNQPPFALGMQEVVSPALPGGYGVLTVWEDQPHLQKAIEKQNKMWWFHLLITLVTIALTLNLVVYWLVARPIGALVHRVRLMRLGYWADFSTKTSTWEIQLLSDHFDALTFQLKQNFQSLVAAERRATQLALAPTGFLPTFQAPAETLPPSGAESNHAQAVETLQNLEALHDKLLHSKSKSAQARGLALEAWSNAAPLAEKLGQIRLKARLEDAAFRIMEPAECEKLSGKLLELRRKAFPEMRNVSDRISLILTEQGIPVSFIESRLKHTAGVWRKMQILGVPIEQINDIFGFRVVVPTVPDCYLAYNALSHAFEPLFERFKNYIADPKPNGYQSLHTCLKTLNGTTFEVQIRTAAMHVVAENGQAAHSSYKTASASSIPMKTRIWWPRPWGSWSK